MHRVQCRRARTPTMAVQPDSPQVGPSQGALRGASAPPATSTFRTGHRRSRSTSSPPTNATNSQEHFEDARSSIHRGVGREEESVAQRQPRASIPEDTLDMDDDLDFLPPLETFFNLVRRIVPHSTFSSQCKANFNKTCPPCITCFVILSHIFLASTELTKYLSVR